MLTVKLYRKIPGENYDALKPLADQDGLFTTKIIEASEVDIHVLRPRELFEVACYYDGSNFTFYIADRFKPKPSGFADEVEFYYAAFVENARGSTTEVVKFD